VKLLSDLQTGAPGPAPGNSFPRVRSHLWPETRENSEKTLARMPRLYALQTGNSTPFVLGPIRVGNQLPVRSPPAIGRELLLFVFTNHQT